MAVKLEKVFGENLKSLRKMRGMTQERLAELVEVSNTSIQGYEYGTRWPGVPIVEKLADALEIPVTSLFGPGRVIEIESKMTVTKALKTLQDALQGKIDREARLSHIPDDVLEMLAMMAPSDMDAVKAAIEGVALGKEARSSRAPHGKKKPRSN